LRIDASSGGTLTNQSGGSKEIELGGYFHGGGDKSLTEFEWLTVTGDVQLAGTLNVHLIDGFKLLAGMSFKILHGGVDATEKQQVHGEGNPTATHRLFSLGCLLCVKILQCGGQVRKTERKTLVAQAESLRRAQLQACRLDSNRENPCPRRLQYIRTVARALMLRALT